MQQKQTCCFRHKSWKCSALQKKKLKLQEIQQTVQTEWKAAVRLQKAKLTKVENFYVHHFGIFSSHHCMPKHNTSIHLANLPTWYYFQHPTNLSSHNLSIITQPPLNFQALLSLGLNFCPQPQYSNKAALHATIERLCRDLYNRSIYAGEEHDYDPKLYAHSN